MITRVSWETSRLGFACFLLGLLLGGSAWGQDGANRFAYLDEINPFHPGPKFPRLITPQWFGETGVDAVVILAVETRGDSVPRIEGTIRPLIESLKEGGPDRVAVSLLSEGRLDPENPQVKEWLLEGVRLESRGNGGEGPLLSEAIDQAAADFHQTVDRLAREETRAVAYRMPGAERWNGASPRAFSEILFGRSDRANFLTIDSSVFCVLDADARAFLPDEGYRNFVEEYPYPYMVGTMCWEFPAILPGDGHVARGQQEQAFQVLRKALDEVVARKGVMTLALSTEGGIGFKNVLKLVAHARATHGERLRFVTFAEALERINAYLLGGQPLRDDFGRDNGVRLMDLDEDGYMDVVLADGGPRRTRVWNKAEEQWVEGEFPTGVRRVDGAERPAAVRFGILNEKRRPLMLGGDGERMGAWMFEEGSWRPREDLLKGLPSLDAAFFRIRDVDGDGQCEVVVGSPELVREEVNGVYFWNEQLKTWKKRPFGLPKGAWVAGLLGLDAGARFIDLNGDGKLDVFYSNEKEFGAALFVSNEEGWSRRLMAGRAGEEAAPPAIAGPFGVNQGFWWDDSALWWQNEGTGPMGKRIPFQELLKSHPEVPGLNAGSP